MSLEARSVETGFPFPPHSGVVRIEYEFGRLSVVIRGLPEEESVVVEFTDVVGFRVLDERDLMEFWPTCSKSNGGLFEIHQGEWLAQELVRPGSCLGPINTQVREFFVTGQDDCVSVLTQNAPRVRKCEL